MLIRLLAGTQSCALTRGLPAQYGSQHCLYLDDALNSTLALTLESMLYFHT